MRDPRAIMTRRAIFTSSSFYQNMWALQRGAPNTVSGDPQMGGNSDIRPTPNGVPRLQIGGSACFQELTPGPKMKA
jgi:hypothetical protein